jgi:hypothetical protein
VVVTDDDEVIAMLDRVEVGGRDLNVGAVKDGENLAEQRGERTAPT